MWGKGYAKFQENLNCGFQFSLSKNCEISSSRRKVQNFKFHQLVLSKRQSTWAENLHSSFLFRERRAVQSLSKIWIVVSNSAYQKIVKFLRACDRAKIWQETKFADFFWPELETSRHFFPKLSMAIQCHKMKVLREFLAEPIYLLEKPIPWNLKFRPSGLLERNSQIFFWAQWETSSHFSSKLCIAFQCHKMKLLPQFLAEPMYLLGKPIPSNLKFQPSGPLAQLNRKPRVTFPPNLPWPFSVIRWHSCHSFWLSQCTFQKSQSHQIWNFDPLDPWSVNGRLFSELNRKLRVNFPPNLPWPFSLIRCNSCHSFWLTQCTF